MKRILMFLLVALCFGQNSVPEWYSNPKKEYPTITYLTATGSGKTLQEAQNAARAVIAQYFTSTVNAYVSSNSITKTDVSSSIKMLGVTFPKTFNDDNGNVLVLGVVNKYEVGYIIDKKMTASMNNIDSLFGLIETTQNSFAKAEVLNKISKKISETQNDMLILLVIAADNFEIYSGKISEREKKAYLLREQIKNDFTISITCGDDKYQRVCDKLSEILENNGLSVSSNNVKYNCKVTITAKEEKSQTTATTQYSIVFVKANIKVEMFLDGKSVFSYNKSLDRAGHADIEQAYNRALVNAEKDLQANFIKKMFNGI